MIFYGFRKVKWSQGCSRTLLVNIKCLRITYSGLKGDLAFDIVSRGLGHSNSFTVWPSFFFPWLGDKCSKIDGEQKDLYRGLIKRDFL